MEYENEKKNETNNFIFCNDEYVVKIFAVSPNPSMDAHSDEFTSPKYVVSAGATPVKEGLAMGGNGNWYYYTDGVVDTAYTGMASLMGSKKYRVENLIDKYLV